MTVITGFHAGSGGDVLEFKVAAWNGGSKGQFFAAPKGDLVALDGASSYSWCRPIKRCLDRQRLQ